MIEMDIPTTVETILCVLMYLACVIWLTTKTCDRDEKNNNDKLQMISEKIEFIKPNYRPPSHMNPIKHTMHDDERALLGENKLIEITTYGDAEKKYLRSEVGWSGDVMQKHSYEARRNTTDRKPLSIGQIQDGIDKNMTYDEYQSQSKECKEMTS